ncbi:hypothetical protein HGM15179_018174 [Zosterops borbonicus]|uniref:Peptidase A2 domain-containing protein n=1 Tax=Zosterops borbonicus TaxID=364589 RepID=A0A8K1FZH7_9PASS|nr:hypothetical protein HGM15179_018174 [Zosterops borbonicus]
MAALRLENITKAKDAKTNYGLRSEAARNILRYIYTADLFCPSDCLNIATLLLTPSQLLIFEREWKRLASEEASKHQTVGDPLYAIQPDMLTGHGTYASSAVQLTYPVKMHQLSQSLALKAILLVPDKKKALPYVSIKQGPSESYSQFIDRSSTSKQGVIVIPGLIDADFTGQVQILAYALQPPVTIPKDSRIAQIVALESFLPHRRQPREPHQKERLDGSFGSTGHEVFFTVDLNDRPIRTVILQRGAEQLQRQLHLDTGLDVSILNQFYWPSDCPLQAPTNHIIGAGGMRIPSISTDPIHITFEEGQVIVAQLYVMPLHAKNRGLLGRDILSQLGLVLTTDLHFS